MTNGLEIYQRLVSGLNVVDLDLGLSLRLGLKTSCVLEITVNRAYKVDGAKSHFI